MGTLDNLTVVICETNLESRQVNSGVKTSLSLILKLLYCLWAKKVSKEEQKHDYLYIKFLCFFYYRL